MIAAFRHRQGLCETRFGTIAVRVCLARVRNDRIHALRLMKASSFDDGE